MSTTRRPPAGDISRIVNDDNLRSSFMRELISQSVDAPSLGHHEITPHVLVQFWDDLSTIPYDVQACLDSWSVLEKSGFKRQLFDDASAVEFIAEHFGSRHVDAFQACLHPAMRADYFRLCFILEIGGFYVDADDEYLAKDLSGLFDNDSLKLQPLCYEKISDSMTDPVQAALRNELDLHIFYVNNSPLIAPPGHPVIEQALERATRNLRTIVEGDRDIQSLTGPGNLTACLVAHVIDQRTTGKARDVDFLKDWESTALSKWPLDYRSDQRDWRKWARGDK